MKCPIRFKKKTLTREEAWELAVRWLSANRKLVREVSTPYRKHMFADREDLLQEALIAAFKAILASQKKKKTRLLARYFIVNFRSQCMKLAYGIRAEDNTEDYEFIRDDEYEEDEERDWDRIEDALQGTSSKNKAICLWLLKHPGSLTTRDIARHFKVSQRHARRVIRTVTQQLSGEA
jgi:DNA-directed RNA polymerase specialized sigma24 family protein